MDLPDRRKPQKARPWTHAVPCRFDGKSLRALDELDARVGGWRPRPSRAALIRWAVRMAADHFDTFTHTEKRDLEEA